MNLPRRTNHLKPIPELDRWWRRFQSRHGLLGEGFVSSGAYKARREATGELRTLRNDAGIGFRAIQDAEKARRG